MSFAALLSLCLHDFMRAFGIMCEPYMASKQLVLTKMAVAVQYLHGKASKLKAQLD